MIRIYESDDYFSISSLFKSCGLEVEVKDVPSGVPIKMYACHGEKAGEIIAASHLGIRDGAFVLKGLAVKEEYRNKGLGKMLISAALECAHNNDAKEVWGCAKVPEYYRKLGWEIVEDISEIPKISHCMECTQFNKSCFPSVIRITL